MERQPSTLIDSLVADLTPSPPMRTAPALARTAIATIASITFIALLMGLRSHVTVLFLLSAGLFLMLGLAASLSVIGIARPQVGSDRSSWAWAAAMAALLPAITLLMGAPDPALAWSRSDPHAGVLCLTMGLISGLASGAVLVAWLRRGAPISPERAGLVTGVAAGSLGMFAFSLYCPDDSIFHIGFWHSGSVFVAALLGRLIVPRLIRW